MKNSLFTSIIILFSSMILISCSKDENNNPTNKEIFLTKEIIKETYNGEQYIDALMYFYDNSNRLVKFVEDYSGNKGDGEFEFIYNFDGTLNKFISEGSYIETYYYSDSRVSKVTGTSNESKDTLNLEYDNSGKILKTTSVKHWSNGSGSVNKQVKTVNYELNSNGNIIQREVTYKEFWDEELIVNYQETVVYQYSENNNLSSSHNNKFDIINNESSWSEYSYEYDTKLNYWPTKHLPKEYLFVELLVPDRDFSTNNVTLSTFNSSSGNYESNIRNITSYSDSGYPLTITANWGSIELEYTEK